MKYLNFEGYTKMQSVHFLKRVGTEAPPWIQQPTEFSSYKYYESGNIDFSICHVTSRWPRNQMAMWFEGRSLI